MEPRALSRRRPWPPAYAAALDSDVVSSFALTNKENSSAEADQVRGSLPVPCAIHRELGHFPLSLPLLAPCI